MDLKSGEYECPYCSKPSGIFYPAIGDAINGVAHCKSCGEECRVDHECSSDGLDYCAEVLVKHDAPDTF